MSLDLYSDFEPPLADEGWTLVEAGNSTGTRMADAGFPERGKLGFRVVIDSTDNAYVGYDYGEALPAGGDFFFAFWLNVRVMPSGTKAVFEIDDAGAAIAEVQLSSAGALAFQMTDDGGTATISDYTIAVGRWYYVAGRVTRATGAATNDGTAEFWVGNYSVGTLAAKDNYNTFENNIGVQVGFASTGTDGAVLDYDEVKTGTVYQQAWSPTPATDYPEVRRTVLLASPSSDGQAFKDYVIQRTGIPRCNVIDLPNATTDESLATAAAWDTQVEDDIDQWVALAADAWAKATTFLAGYGVPGYFTDGGLLHSATSRLMHYGTAFGSGTANTLYAPATVERLTVTSLNAAGLYLASRIDADSLANAKAVLDAGLAADMMAVLRETDILYTDDSVFRTALDTQHLRLETALMT